MSIWIRRAYEAPTRNDGFRVLVDRVWPRGASKQQLELDDWLREVAPSTPLRKWFGHDPTRWEEFQRRYLSELRRKERLIRALLDRIRHGRITLVYGARDRHYNNAVALRAFLRERTRRDGNGRESHVDI